MDFLKQDPAVGQCFLIHICLKTIQIISGVQQSVAAVLYGARPVCYQSLRAVKWPSTPWGEVVAFKAHY